jgi:hypothetical protein
MEATTKDLRLRAPELLAAADRGEVVVITYRGQRRAEMRRWAGAGAPEGGRNPAFGLWADRRTPVGAHVRALRARRQLP